MISDHPHIKSDEQEMDNQHSKSPVIQQTTSKHSKEEKGMVWKGESSKTMPQVIHTQTITRIKNDL